MRRIPEGLATALLVTISLSQGCVSGQTMAASPTSGQGASSPTALRSGPKSLALLSDVDRAVTYHSVRVPHIETLIAYLYQNPKDAFARYLLARVFEQKGYILLSQEQDDIAAHSWLEPESMLALFKHHVEEGNTDSANPMSPIIGKMFPESPYRRFLDGIFFEEKGRTVEAVAVYDELLRSADCPFGVATRRASLELQNNNFPRVLELTEIDLAVRPDYVPAIIARSQALLKSGDAAAAARLLTPHSNAHPFNRRLTLSLYYTFMKVGRFEEALACAMRILAQTDSAGIPDSSRRVKNLIVMLGEQVSTKVLIAVTEQVDQTEYSFKFHHRMGDILLELKRPAEALAQYKASLFYNGEYDPPVIKIGNIMCRYERLYEPSLAQIDKAKTMQVGENSFLLVRRLRARLPNRKRDVAWRIQDWVAGATGRWSHLD